jgi:hypothetical protein
MNSWDPEMASCAAPEDKFDPDRESTLAYNASAEETTEDNYEVPCRPSPVRSSLLVARCSLLAARLPPNIPS